MGKIEKTVIGGKGMTSDIEECWNALETMKWDFVDEKKLPTGIQSVQWTHLQDALTKNTVSKMECYDAINLGYCPEHLKVRDSSYKGRRGL